MTESDRHLTSVAVQKELIFSIKKLTRTLEEFIEEVKIIKENKQNDTK